jgi:hypothetical protein
MDRKGKKETQSPVMGGPALPPYTYKTRKKLTSLQSEEYQYYGTKVS